MNLEQAKNIVESCSKARFTLQFLENILPLCDYLNIFGNQLDSVQFFDCVGQDTAPGWNLCSNIREVVVGSDTRLDGIQALLQSPKCSLKTIELNFGYDFTDFKNCMDAFVAARVTTLESVVFGCPLPPVNAFYMMVTRNSSLRDARISLEDGPELEDGLFMERVTEIVECFVRCPALELLVISSLNMNRSPLYIDGVHQLLRKKYRHRGFHASVCSHSFS